MGAYAIDLLGLGVIGNTLQETEELIRDDTAVHLAVLAEDGLFVPEPTSCAERVAVPA